MDDFERVCEEDGSNISQVIIDELFQWCFIFFFGNEGGLDLFVGEEFNIGVREDLQECCGVVVIEVEKIFMRMDVFYC